MPASCRYLLVVGRNDRTFHQEALLTRTTSDEPTSGSEPLTCSLRGHCSIAVITILRRCHLLYTFHNITLRELSLVREARNLSFGVLVLRE
jgi:hypothetical protein